MVLPNSMRLRGHRCFDHIHRTGMKYHGSLMIIRVAKSNSGLIRSHKKPLIPSTFKCAIAISNKVSKKAVIRNRLRRVLHNHLKARLSNKVSLYENWALISLKPNPRVHEENLLLGECDKLLLKAGLLI